MGRDEYVECLLGIPLDAGYLGPRQNVRTLGVALPRFVPNPSRHVVKELHDHYGADLPFTDQYTLSSHNKRDYMKRLRAYDIPLTHSYDAGALSHAFLLCDQLFARNLWSESTADAAVANFEPTSSAGICDLWSCHTKREWITDCYPDLYMQYRAELLNGRRHVLWKQSLKEEILPIEEGAVKKSRVFMFPDAAFNVLEGIYIAPFQDVMISQCMEGNSSGAGLPTTGGNWDNLQKYLRQKNLWVELDASQYDASMIQVLLLYCRDLRKRTYIGPNRGEVFAWLDIIYEQYIHSIMISPWGDLLTKEASHNSGGTNTLNDNCIRTIVIILYCIIRKFGAIDLHFFDSHFRLTDCGDDVISTNDVGMPAADFVTLAKELNVTYTAPPTPPDIDHYTFISCGTTVYKDHMVPVCRTQKGVVSAIYSERPNDVAYNLMRITGIYLSNPFNDTSVSYLDAFVKIIWEKNPHLHEDLLCCRAYQFYHKARLHGRDLYLPYPTAVIRRIYNSVVECAPNISAPQNICYQGMSTRDVPQKSRPARVPVAAELQKLRNQLANQQAELAKLKARSKPAAPKPRAKRNQARKQKVAENRQMVLYKQPSTPNFANSFTRTAPAENMLKPMPGAVMLNGTPECFQNYVKLLTNPFRRPKGDVCSTLGRPTNTVYSSCIKRITTVTDPNGEAFMVFNPFCCINDVRALTYSSGMVGAVQVDTDYSLGGLVGVQLDDHLLSYNDLHEDIVANNNAGRARVIAAGICVSPLGNATNTQGSVYSYTSAGNAPFTTHAFSDIVAEPTNPRANLSLNGCYANVFVPADTYQSDFLSGETNKIINSCDGIHGGIHPNSGHGVLVLYVTGLPAGYPLLFEVASHVEFYDPSKYTQFTKPTEQYLKASTAVAATLSQVKMSEVAITPGEGFFDKVIDTLGDTISTYAPKVIGTLASLFL